MKKLALALLLCMGCCNYYLPPPKVYVEVVSTNKIKVECQAVLAVENRRSGTYYMSHNYYSVPKGWDLTDKYGIHKASDYRENVLKISYAHIDEWPDKHWESFILRDESGKKTDVELPIWK